MMNLSLKKKSVGECKSIILGIKWLSELYKIKIQPLKYELRKQDCKYSNHTNSEHTTNTFK